MRELIFVVEEADEGGYTARALEAPIFTEADTVEALRQNIKEAISCHFDAEAAPQVIRLHFVRDELIAL